MVQWSLILCMFITRLRVTMPSFKTISSIPAARAVSGGMAGGGMPGMAVSEGMPSAVLVPPAQSEIICQRLLDSFALKYRVQNKEQVISDFDLIPVSHIRRA
eukprot:808523_1